MAQTIRFALALLLFGSTGAIHVQMTPKLDASVTYIEQRSLKANTGENFWSQGGSIQLGVDAWHGLGVAADVTGVQCCLDRFKRDPALDGRGHVRPSLSLACWPPGLFAETRSEDLAQLSLHPDDLSSLLMMRYRGLRTTYAAQYPEARLLILCSGDGAAVGKVLPAPLSDHCRIVDLAVAKSAQRRGWGTLSILACQQACQSRGLALRLAVSSKSSARSLYARAGFVELDHQDATCVGQFFTPNERQQPLFRELMWRP